MKIENLTVEEIIGIIDIIKKENEDFPDRLILKTIQHCYTSGISKENLLKSVIKTMNEQMVEAIEL